MADGPLSDLLVLDLTRALAGPHAGMMLGDLGARVIKIESPTGDDTRSWGPPFVGPEDARESTYFLSANRNKESLVLDLKSPEDCDVLARLVARADVLMENFRVGVLDRLGFPVARLHELNPGLVILSITGFGHDGPEASRAGYDQIAQGEGGLMSITGTSQPTKVGVPIADLIAGMNGAFGVVAALHERTRTGRGRVVRTSLLAGMVGVHAFQGTKWTVAGEVPGPLRRPPSVDRAVRHVRDRYGADPDRLWLGGAVAGPLHGVGVGPGRGRLRHQPRTGREQGLADREAGVALRLRRRRALAGVAVRRRCAVRQGALDGRRLLLGAGAVAGPQAVRRPPDARRDRPPRTTAALRRQPVLRRPLRPTSLRPTLGQHNESIREWLDS